MFPRIGNITFEETPERLKIVMPVQRNWLLFGLFTICLLVWVVMLAVILVFLIRDVIMTWERFSLVLTIMLLIWLYIWYRLGRIVWNWWQYYLADREILFINREQLIVRRPVSILGITNVYDMSYVSPFYYSDRHDCPAFDYAYQHVYFGQSLAENEAGRLVQVLNSRYFPET